MIGLAVVTHAGGGIMGSGLKDLKELRREGVSGLIVSCRAPVGRGELACHK